MVYWNGKLKIVIYRFYVTQKIFINYFINSKIAHVLSFDFKVTT